MRERAREGRGERGEKRRKGRPQIHEHSAAHTPGRRCQEPSGQQGACVRHSWEKWMPRINQAHDTLSRAIRVYSAIRSPKSMLRHRCTAWSCLVTDLSFINYTIINNFIKLHAHYYHKSLKFVLIIRRHLPLIVQFA